ncbi:MAG TPA: TAXI family TRAP transporter solute-binding subunit [candidate division Zixibacteria bacterium]|nr:TAXI family TRAP transporter solute-binding subunit [candidate division Zixibacteria bacterium]
MKSTLHGGFVRVALGAVQALFLFFFADSAGAQKVERITFVGGPPAGVFGIFATGIGTHLSKTVPNLDVSVTATGGSVENIRRVNGGEADMGLSFSSDLHEAYFGQAQFKGKALTNPRAVGLVFFGVAHAITFADSGIRTVEDLVGKRVAVGTPGSGTFASAERVFRAVGIWEKINRIPLLGAQAGEAMADGKADAFFWTGPEPDRVTTEAATKKPVRAIDIYTPVSKTDFFKQYPYFARYVFPANSYRGITEDTPTVGIPVIWYVNRNLAPSLVQKMVAAAYDKEGHAHMLKVHAGARDMVPQKALQGVTVPLHKGAEDHWRAAGIQIPDSLRSR